MMGLFHRSFLSPTIAAQCLCPQALSINSLPPLSLLYDSLHKSSLCTQDSTSPSQPAARAHPQFVPQDLEVLCFKYALSSCVHGGCYILIAHPKYTPPRALFALLPPVANPYHPINLPVMQYRRSEPLVPVSPNVLPDAFTHRSISNSVCIIIGPTIICQFHR
ncbi:hypothetical protein C8J57DRAFT_1342614 [Mycena rebaudengoi]|nr:hypothetical protein C8J57DRAFT_1342614 [Mycena rebaudengoi]